MTTGSIVREWFRSQESGALEEGSPRSPDEADWVWIDIERPDEHSLGAIGARFDIDELALEDALDPGAFPQHEDLGRFLVVILHSVHATDHSVKTTPMVCFVGTEFLVTTHHESLQGMEFVIETAKTHLRTAEGGPDRMLARLADAGSRRFEPVLEEIDALLVSCEALALDGESAAVRRLQPIRRQIRDLRAVIRPQRSVLQALVYSDSSLLGDRAQRRLTDVLERHARMVESLEVARSAANGVVELHRGAVADRTNDIMKVLTIFSATLMPMSLLAGIYGMNFVNMPELDARLGYPIVLVAMVAVALLMWRYFVWRGFVGRPRIDDVAAGATSTLVHAARRPVDTVGSLIAGGLQSARGLAGSAGPDRSN